ncbi:protein phosphatase 2C domain-containing protein [Actinopolymorpha alba]|uniref:protein phosphatase 2C domain-containing protein n=1 Tax=Actinopolymorpha alba TaxID=533267 RepID=UPI000374A36A|nr:protein phosphatase 2C domain-containing protein [Actinopolymorpha alba]
MQVAVASVAARPDRVNEDFFGTVPTAAVLLDGAGMSGIESICSHGVAWYTGRLGGELLGRLWLDPDQDLPTLLAQAIERVADAHRNTCDLANPRSPSATVAILRLCGGRADYLVLGDSVLILDQVQGKPLIVDDRREEMVRRRYRPAFDAAKEGSAEYDRALSDYIAGLRANRNQPGGFWLAKGDPRAALEAITGSCRISDLAGAALLSNGASRIVDRFGLADWPEVLTLLRAHGPAEIIRRVREAEMGGPNGASLPRALDPDDATIAHCMALADGLPGT